MTVGIRIWTLPIYLASGAADLRIDGPQRDLALAYSRHSRRSVPELLWVVLPNSPS